MPAVALLVATCACTEFPVGDAMADPEASSVYEFAERADEGELRWYGSLYDFTLDEHLSRVLVEGWSTPESVDPEGVTYVWAIARTARLRLPVLERADRWLHLRCRPFRIRRALPQRVRILVNDTEIGETDLQAQWTEYSYQIPARALRAGDNLVTFEFAYAEMPWGVEADSDDKRLLAAAFDYVAISRQQAFDASVARRRSAASHRGTGTRLEQPLGTEVMFNLTVPPDGALEYGIAGRGQGEVLIRRAGHDDVLVFSEPAGGQAGRRFRADLSRVAGTAVGVIFRAVGDDGEGGVAWEEPRLVGHAGDANVTASVLLIVVDTLRADFLRAYGGEVDTPTLDALAASGVLFRNAYSAIPITVPSHATMFTGLLPGRHGARTNGHVLGAEPVTLAEIMRRGYRKTAAVVSLGVLEAGSGLGRGFTDYHDRFDLDWWKTAGSVNQELLSWFDRQGRTPFFVWAHYSDPHEPYTPPERDYLRVSVVRGGERTDFAADARTAAVPLVVEPGTTDVSLTSPSGVSRHPLKLRLRTTLPAVTVECVEGCTASRSAADDYVTHLPARLSLTNPTVSAARIELRMQVQEGLPLEEIRRRYREEVEYTDRQIGELHRALRNTGRLDDTLVIVTSDHGEMLGENGSGLGHVDDLFDPVLRVPLIVSWPGRLPAGRIVESLVSHTDLFPTIVDLLGMPDPGGHDGRSLVPLMTGKDRWADDRPIVAETFRPEAVRDLRAIIAGGFKLIVSPDGRRTALYDLAADPSERTDAALDRPDVAGRLAAVLDSLASGAPGRRSSTERVLSEEQLDRLRSLGYVR